MSLNFVPQRDLEQLLKGEIARVAQLAVALRHAVSEAHAADADASCAHTAGPHWVRCPHPLCTMARKALDGATR